MTKGCGLTLHVGDFLPWAVGGRFHSHVPSLLKADFLFCLSFLSERPPPPLSTHMGSSLILLHTQQFVWASSLLAGPWEMP